MDSSSNQQSSTQSFYDLTAISILTTGYLVSCTAGPPPEGLSGLTTEPGATISINQINHADYDLLLKKYVNLQGDVDYTAWKKSGPNQVRLQNYLNHLSRADLTLPATKEAKLAYWVNAYNALTLAGILNFYPTSSIPKPYFENSR